MNALEEAPVAAPKVPTDLELIEACLPVIAGTLKRKVTNLWSHNYRVTYFGNDTIIESYFLRVTDGKVINVTLEDRANQRKVPWGTPKE